MVQPTAYASHHVQIIDIMALQFPNEEGEQVLRITGEELSGELELRRTPNGRTKATLGAQATEHRNLRQALLGYLPERRGTSANDEGATESNDQEEDVRLGQQDPTEADNAADDPPEPAGNA